MKPKQISIPSSGTSQQISTPSWAPRKGQPLSKMSRLDELLSRNEQIYQNMRNQLQEITKSNQNIDANISIIKPYYESGGYGEDGEKIGGVYRETYSFNDRSEGEQSVSASRGYTRNIQRIQESTQTSNKRAQKSYTESQQQSRVTPQEPQQSQPKTSSFTPQPQPVHKNSAYLYPPKKPSQKMQAIQQSRASSYHEPDSSPIESEGNFMESIRNSYHNSDAQGQLRSRIKGKKYEDEEVADKRYQTFEEDPKIETVDEKEEYQSGEKQSIQHSHNPYGQSPPASNPQPLALPPQTSLLFIPFNRLYSSPILQQTNKKQIILARKSKTQVVPNNSINRIVNGIKYKNVNLVNQEIGLYGAIMDAVRRVEHVLTGYWGAEGEGKDSVDVGIIGGHNSLKKKIHYAMIAHIYSDLIQQISTQIQHTLTQTEPAPYKLLFTIEHQEQQTGSEPSLISYQGELLPQAEPSENKIVYANIDAVVEQIFEEMKIRSALGSESALHRIRVTRLCLQKVSYPQPPSKQGEPLPQLHTLSNTKIISTNKIDLQFIEDLELDIAVWCVNPLFKYYDQTYNMLECYMANGNRNRARNTGR